jgi:hypothetical protein
VFETTLVAMKGQTKDELSPLARRIADGVFGDGQTEGLPADGTLGTDCGLRLHHPATQILAANRLSNDYAAVATDGDPAGSVVTTRLLRMDPFSRALWCGLSGP